MDELVTWLRGCLDEDERVAERVRQAYANEEFWAPAAVINAFALVDPARALREVEVKRGVIRLYENAAAAQRAGSASRIVATQDAAASEVLYEVVRLLASAYADRAGYQEAWRP